MKTQKTQIQIIRELLIKGEEVTSILAFSRYKITRLSSIIHSLRKTHGMVEIQMSLRDNGRGAQYGVYYLKSRDRKRYEKKLLK